MEESDLIEKSKLGNKSALNKLLTDNYPIVKGYVIKMTGDPHLSQDIVQETMLKAVVNINRFTPKAKFSTWLIKIAINIYRDYLRKNKNIEVHDDELQSSDPGLEEATITGIEYKEIINVLMSLPYEKRAVFVLKHYYGYKYEEIARILDCPVGTVRSRLHNSIRHIITELEKRRMI